MHDSRGVVKYPRRLPLGRPRYLKITPPKGPVVRRSSGASVCKTPGRAGSGGYLSKHRQSMSHQPSLAGHSRWTLSCSLRRREERGRARRIRLSPAEDSGTNGAVSTPHPGFLRDGVPARNAGKSRRIICCAAVTHSTEAPHHPPSRSARRAQPTTEVVEQCVDQLCLVLVFEPRSVPSFASPHRG